MPTARFAVGGWVGAKDLPLVEKLYGDLAALRRMAAFVRGAGVSI